jgi:hypothetical protein
MKIEAGVQPRIGTAVPEAMLCPLSRSEAEGLAFKAARGAGLGWGLAEEAAFATGWLAAQGIDGAGALLACLVARMSRPAAPPVMTKGRWSAGEGRALCPLATGVALVDFAFLEDGPFAAKTALELVHLPVLLLPFLSQVTIAKRQTVRIDWNGHVFDLGASLAVQGAAFAKFCASPAAGLSLSLGGPLPETPVAPDRAGFAAVSTYTLSALESLALRTTVPATEASRQGGAGAGTSDND